MTSKFYSGLKTVAYASLSIGDNDFNELSDYCLKQPFPVDTYAEETESFLSDRPTLNQVLHLIEQKQIQSLVIPSIEHVLGGRFSQASDFLKYLRLHGVELLNLAAEANSHVIH